MTCPSCHTSLADGARFCGACGMAFASTETQSGGGGATAPVEMIGRQVAGRYRIVGKLGEGGMGAVFRAEQISLKRAVALKVLRPEMSSNPSLLRRFNAEAELVAKLSHPNTVNIYDFGQDTDGALFIAMELIEGRSLRAVLREGPLPPHRALGIAAQLCASLADAHAHGIIHRDLKPDNVMLQSRGKEQDVVRVLDFGIAKLRDDSRSTQMMTQAGDLLGTPQYMAPEQIRGEAIDGRTDIYALGCMIYEMLTARMPFEGPTVMALLSKHLMEQAVPPSQRRPDLRLAPPLDLLCAGAMAKDPAARPPTMDAYLARIAALQPMYAAAASVSAARPAVAGPTPWIAPMGYAGFEERPPAPPPEPMRPVLPPGPPSAIQHGYGGVGATAVSSAGLAAARAIAGPTEMVDPLPRPALIRGPNGALMSGAMPARGGGRAVIIIAIVAAVAIFGVGIGVLAFRQQSAPPEKASAGSGEPSVWDSPGSADDGADPWAKAAHGVAPPVAPELPTGDLPLPPGATLSPPDAVRVYDTPGGQHYVDQRRGIHYFLAPLIAGTNDPAALAKHWESITPGIKFQKVMASLSAGTLRPALLFSGTRQTPRGVEQVAQVIILYIEPSYRVGLLIQIPVSAYQREPQLAEELDGFLAKNVSLP